MTHSQSASDSEGRLGAGRRTDEGTTPVRGRVHRLLVEEFELAEPDLNIDADLYADLGLDSLDTVDLVVALKEEFGFDVDRVKDEERIRAVRTLEDLYAFVEVKMGGATQRRAANGE